MMKTNIRKIIKIAVIFMMLGTFSEAVLPAHAQDSVAATKAEFEEVFQKMLDDPSDLDVTLRYAELAVKLKDYEAAIPALERILLFNPSLSKVKADLGVLYYLLDSYDVAREYFIDAKEGNDVPQDIIERADKYLTKIKEKLS